MLAWYVYALVGAALFGIQIVVAKRVLGHEHALEWNAMRGLFSIMLCLLLIPFVEWEAITWQMVLLLYFISIMAVAAILYRSKAHRHLEVSYAAPLENIHPLFLLIISFFLLGETVSPLQFGGILVVLSGGYLLQIPRRHESVLEPIRRMLASRHVHYLIFATVVFAFTATMDKYVFNTFSINPATYLLLTWIFIGVNFVILDYARFGLHDFSRDLRRDGRWILLAAIFSIASLYFHFTAMSMADVSLVIPIRRSSALFAVLIGGKLFNETHLTRKLIASALMVIGVALIIL